jgi:hypothetical protein
MEGAKDQGFLLRTYHAGQGNEEYLWIIPSSLILDRA